MAKKPDGLESNLHPPAKGFSHVSVYSSLTTQHTIPPYRLAAQENNMLENFKAGVFPQNLSSLKYDVAVLKRHGLLHCPSVIESRKGSPNCIKLHFPGCQLHYEMEFH